MKSIRYLKDERTGNYHVYSRLFPSREGNKFRITIFFLIPVLAPLFSSDMSIALLKYVKYSLFSILFIPFDSGQTLFLQKANLATRIMILAFMIESLLKLISSFF